MDDFTQGLRDSVSNVGSAYGQALVLHSVGQPSSPRIARIEYVERIERGGRTRTRENDPPLPFQRA